VSAQDLKAVTTFKKDDVAYGITRDSDRVDTRLFGSVWSGVGDFIGGVDDWKKTYQEEAKKSTEFFTRLTPYGIESVSATGERATLFMTPYTPEQREELDLLSPTEQKIFGVEKKSESALLIDIKKLEARQQQAREIDKLTIEINNLVRDFEKQGKIDTLKNEFTDKITQKEIDDYNKKYSQLEKKKAKLGERELYTGVGWGLGKKVDVLGAGVGISALPQTVGVVGGMALGKLGKEKGYFDITTPEQEVDVFLPKFGTEMKGTIIKDPVTGEPMTGKQKVIIPEKTYTFGTTSQFETVGEVGATVGLYSIPIMGTGLFGYEVGKRFKQTGYSPTKFVIENPLETVLIGGVGASKISKFYKKTLGKEIIDVEKITLEAKKQTTPFGVVSRPTILQTERGTAISRDVYGYSQTLQAGQRTIVTTRIRKMLGLNPIFTGNPYIEQQAYQKALKLLTNRGYTEKQARELLRLRRPKFDENIFKGEAVALYGEDSLSILLRGKQKTKQIEEAKFGDLMIKKDIELRRIYAEGYPIEVKGMGDTFKLSQKELKSYITKEGREFQKLRQAGKTTEQFEVITSAKELGKVTLPTKKVGDILLGKEFKAYKEVGISKKVIPKKRKIDTSLSTIFVEKGVPKFEITLDTGVRKSLGFMRGRRKSSEQFLEQLYQEEKGISAILSKTIKPKLKEKVVKTKIPSVKIDKTGLGLKVEERLALGLGTSTKQIIKQRELQRARERQRQKVMTTTKVAQIQKTIPKLKEAFYTPEKLADASALKLSQLQLQQQSQIQALGMGGVSLLDTQPLPKIKSPKIPKILYASSEDKRRKEEEKRLNEPVHVFVKSKGKRIKVEPKPVTRRAGRDSGAFAVDKTLSAEFSLKKAKGKAQPPTIKVPPNYYQRHFFKFRPFQIKKGVKKPLKDAYIENAPFRLDTASEVQKIHAEKWLAQQRKQAQQKQVRQRNLNKLFFPVFAQNSRPKTARKKKASNINKIAGFDPNLNII